MSETTGPRRYTLTITPATSAELDEIIDGVRARHGRKHLIHVIGDQPSGEHVGNAPELPAALDQLDGLLKQRAATEKLLADTEREYVRTLNALLACHPDADHDYHRWTGLAVARRETATALRAALGLPAVDYGSAEWRTERGVYSPEQVAEFQAVGR